MEIWLEFVLCLTTPEETKDGCTKASHLASETKPAAGSSFSELSGQLLLIDWEERRKITSVQIRSIKAVSARAKRNFLP